MSALSSHRHLLVSAVIAALAIGGIADAHAQTAAERLAERRAAREGSRGGAQEKAEAEYPAATRKDPGLSASSRLTPKINAVSEAQQAGDVAAAEAAGADVLGDERANAYERAITLRLIADLLIDEDPVRAKDYLRQSIELDGLGNNEHFSSMFMLSQLQLRDDQYAESLATLDRLLAETKSDKQDLQVLRGNILYRMDRFDEAATVLEPLVRGKADASPEARQLLLAVYSEGNRASEAAALAEEIATQTPGDKSAQLNLATVYLQADDYPNAIAVYERLRQSGDLTEERDYRNLSALLLNTDGGEPKAIEVLNDGLQKGILPGDYKTYALLAQAYYFSDQHDKAIEFYQKAAPLDEDGNTYLNLAKALSNEGRDAESKAAAQKALDKGLTNPEEARKLLAR
ncbi:MULTISPECIES: tetratricopeptide repeat protein [unclassified Luteimonas]